MVLKKAQIQIAENIGVLVVFFIFLVFGLVFYANLRSAAYVEKIDDFEQLQSIAVSQKVLYMPELICFTGFNIVDDYCFDSAKMDAFDKFLNANKDIMETNYYDYFGNSRIEVQEILPGNKNWLLYNRSTKSGYERTYLPINIYNPTEDRYHLGILKVDVYQDE